MDLVLTTFDIAESRVIVDGVTSAAVTLTGQVTLGTVESTSFQSILYWSKDQVLDNSDINSGKVLALEDIQPPPECVVGTVSTHSLLQCQMSHVDGCVNCC